MQEYYGIDMCAFWMCQESHTSSFMVCIIFLYVTAHRKAGRVLSPNLYMPFQSSAAISDPLVDQKKKKKENLHETELLF